MRSHAPPPPQHLPDDYVEDSAPKPPPNHDGDLGHDAGRALQDAVPFALGTRQGRIAEDDDGDGWILTGDAGARLDVRVENLSSDTLLHVAWYDAAERPLYFPESASIFAHDDAEWTLEFPHGDAPSTILLIVQADRPLDYRIHTATR